MQRIQIRKSGVIRGHKNIIKKNGRFAKGLYTSDQEIPITRIIEFDDIDIVEILDEWSTYIVLDRKRYPFEGIENIDILNIRTKMRTIDHWSSIKTKDFARFYKLYGEGDHKVERMT